MVSVIIATYNRAAYLRLCLAALAAQDYRGSWEIVVADDGSTDETPQVIAEATKRRPDVPIAHCWREHKLSHKTAIVNEGARRSSGGLLVFLDSDSVPATDLLSVYAAHAAPKSFCLGGTLPLSREFSERALAAGPALGIGEFLSQAASPPNQGERAMQKLRARHWKSRVAILFGVGKPKIRGSNFAASRDAFEGVNGFDEDFVGYGQDDSDLRDRLLMAGCRPVCLYLKALAYHLWHPDDLQARREALGDGSNRAYYRRRVPEAVCRNGLRKL